MVRFEFAHETKKLLCLKTVPWDFFFFGRGDELSISFPFNLANTQ